VKDGRAAETNNRGLTQIYADGDEKPMKALLVDCCDLSDIAPRLRDDVGSGYTL
jgi:hypothetical protein